MSTFTLEQKRLEQLRKQLYGKQANLSQPRVSKKDSKSSDDITVKTSHQTTTIPGEDHIKKDLLKVGALSIIAILFQFILYSAISNNWVNLSTYGINF
jgi:predicted nucleotide-binding protein (sugar kinase/HSP70/actin superfamily)